SRSRLSPPSSGSRASWSARSASRLRALWSASSRAPSPTDVDLPWLKPLFDELSRIEGYLDTLVHPNLVLAHILDDSVGLLLDLWFKFLLSTTDIESGGDFIASST